MPRYIIIGAGAIGVTFAAELQRAGHGVALIARGAQLDAARNGGITYVRPDGPRRLGLSVHAGPHQLDLNPDDVLVLATKTQDAAPALLEWARQPVRAADGSVSSAGESLVLLTTQNGLETERVALRYFATVVGGVLALPGHFVEPGVVVAPGAPAVGAAWIGAYPDRELPIVDEIARHLRRANIETAAVANISHFKHGKLVVACTFVLDALYPPGPLRDRAAALLRQEASEVLVASGHELTDIGAAFPARGFAVQPIPGYAYGGTSTWQSLARAGSLETEFINGEVTLQARLAGLQAPANAAVTARIAAAARDGLAPRSLDDADLLATFPQLRQDVLVDVPTLARRVRGPQPPALLDVRWRLGDPDGIRHYEHGHLPGAVYVDLDTELAAAPSPEAGRHPLPEIDELQAAARHWGVGEGQPVVVYDDTGGLAAARAWWLLRWAGVEQVEILDGGLGAWTAAALPLEQGPYRPEPGDVTLSAGHLAVLDAEQAAELADRATLFDARAGERYRGEVEPIDPRAGHIPGAVSAPTTDNIADDGRFLEPDALRERFAGWELDDAPVVGVYCGSGVTAAHEIAALRIAGIDAALFPGSWSAWSSDPDRPVAVGPEPEPPITRAAPAPGPSSRG